MFPIRRSQCINKYVQTTEKLTFCTQNAKEKTDLNLKAKFLRTVVKRITSGAIFTKPTDSAKIVIDYSSPNIAKPFHVGHLRSTIIGNFIANINQFYNNQVVRLNYLGDWGTQFGLLQCGLKIKNINLSNSNNLMSTLFEAYVHANKLAKTDNSLYDKARQYFSDVESGKESLEDWRKIREITVRELEVVYQRLGIKFDDYHWESDYNASSIRDLFLSLEQKGIIINDESGRKVSRIGNKNVSVLKSDGSTLYISRDIAALIDRYNRYQFDKMLYIVDNSQNEHFTSLFEIMKQINPNCVKGCEHIKFGRIHGMSTRSGNVVFLSDILDEAKERMFEKQKLSKNTPSEALNEETCDILGTSAVILNDLKQRRQKNYVFEWDKVLQVHGDSGIKLQYLHCRLWSLEKKCDVTLPDECDPTYLTEDIVVDVVSELAKFEDLLQRSYSEKEACILLSYLFRLTKLVNRMFNELRVKGENPDVAAQRLLIFHCARKIVKTGLEILGVKPLYQM